MFELFGCVAAAIAAVAPVARCLGDIAQGGRQMLGLAEAILDLFSKKVPPERQAAAMREALAEAAAMAPEPFAKVAEQIAEQCLPGQPPEYRQAVAEYLQLMPARIRASFARPEDPSGTTAPARWAVQRPEDLLALLPPRPPRFRQGDTPPEAGRWVLVERLGIGGFGEVWKAQSRTMKNTFTAFKFCLDPASQQRMLQHEMEIIEQVKNELVDHPHIVKLQDAYLEGDAPWLQYEYVPGGDLSQVIGTWPPDLGVRARVAVDVLKTLARTVAHCHQLRPAVVHRDLKPGNILLGRDGKLKITDFGISDTLARQALDEARLATVSHVSCSTPSMVRWAHTPLYASPQQKDGLDPHPSDDVHSLGVMLYQLLMGNINLPLGADFRDDLAEMGVCKPLLDLLSRSVAARVGRRYQNAGEMSEALEALPADLLAKGEASTEADKRRVLYAQIGRVAADAKAKNEAARRQMDRREWAAALKTLQSIFHPHFRDAELYDQAVAYRDGKRYVNPLGMEFVLLPKGAFWMGGGDGVCGDRQVAVPQGFFIGTHPVTQEEWQMVMGSNPSHHTRAGAGAAKLGGVTEADLKRFPVEGVSWHDCQAYIKKLNEKLDEAGWVYCLPREAEWEYACRAGATSKADCEWSYYFRTPANALTPQQANYADSNLGRPCRVGQYPANAVGLHDMHGNVWEWCEDANGSNRVYRGGSWAVSAARCRASGRGSSDPASGDGDIGLRLVRAPLGAA